MRNPLNIFIRALEESKNKVFRTRTSIEPMLKPAYKEVKIELYEKGKGPEPIMYVSGVYKITSDAEKEEAIEQSTQELITNILKSYETI